MNALTIALSCAALASAGWLLAQEKEGKPDARPQDAAAAPPMPKPGPEHQPLRLLVGTWEADIEHTMKPGDPPAKSKGVETTKLVCNGLWLESDVRAELGPQTFEGHGHFGYDTVKKAYRSTWIDNMSTHLATSEGTFDAGTKTFTMMGEGPDMTGRMTKFRMTDQIKGDTRLLTSYTTGPDGKEFVHLTIRYTKKK